jgi:hypothetical protein
MCVVGVTLHKSPEKELEEFLASKPAWMQRVLQEDLSSFSSDELSEWNSNQDAVFKLKPECERLLRQIPAKWNQYRNRQKRNCQPLLQMMISKSRPGRPRKAAIAQEAAKLRHAGMNDPQIAAELNKRHGRGTATSESVRKLRNRHSDKFST